jgi:electron transfer flavoprotein beta subunit
MKNIIVCMKQVLDPEIPLSLFHIDNENKRAVQPKATPPVFSPFDENALEAALKIKDGQEASVTVISLSRKFVRTVVTSSLAAGADQLVLLQDDIFNEFNTFLTAQAIAKAIRKIGAYDLILCGLQSADTNSGLVGTGVASILGIPCVTGAHKVEIIGDKVKVEKPSVDGFELIETSLPAVVTTSYEVGTLREPGVEAFMSASQKPIIIWKAQELEIATNNVDRFNMISMDQPSQDKKCVILEGSSPEEKVIKLVTKLKEIKVI